MASTSSYGDPSAQMGGDAGLYVNQNGGTPPTQQQQQQMHSDDLQLHEDIQRLRQSSGMMDSSGPQPPQMQQLAQMGSAMNAPHHHHFHTPPRPTHSPQQMAQSVMSLEEHNPYADHDPASRKRSKVSRACDECRRKKIRCDATSENGPEACSSCKRTGARCQFSRQPMKRGPSKGYIKELADRLNSLENQIQHPQPPAPSYEFAGLEDPALGATQVTPQFSRKRTHSMSEQFHDTFSRPSWTGQDREYPINGNRRTSFGEMTLAGSLITGSNEGTLKAYYNTIHPTFPVLPHDSSSLNRLTHCPPKLRETFFLSIESSVRSFAPRALPAADVSLTQLLHQCFESVDAAKHTLNDHDSSRQFFNELIYCQSLVLLTIASDKPGPGTVGNTTELLGRIAGCISEMGLNETKILNALREQDHEIFQATRRLFWVAFILDRFHASSKSKDIILPLHSGSVSRDDYNALEEAPYHLARAADIVGQVAYITRAGSVPNLDSSSPFALTSLTATSPTSLYLSGQLARFRESIDISNLTSNSPPHLAYQYLRIFVARLNSFASSNEILALTQELLNNLNSGPITPLNHVFASLVATSLSDLSDRVETQVEAHASIKEMSDALNNGQIIHRSADNLGWDAAIRELLHQKQTPTPQATGPEQTSPADQPNMAGLQHLAAAAVGEREGVDVRPVSSGGGNESSATAQSAKVDHDLSAAMAAANEAAKAQATAAAAQQQMQSTSTNGNGGTNYDPSTLVKDGFMSALS